MSDVFISHVEEDADLALEIAHGLETAAFTAWYYERDSVLGLSYLLQTGRAIEECHAVVLLISSHSVGSNQVTKEVERAHECGKPIIPVLRDLTHAEFQNRQPLWRQVIGTATSITVPPQGTSAIMPRMIAGLHGLGITPSHRGMDPGGAVEAPGQCHELCAEAGRAKPARGSIPAAVATFVGREQERAQVAVLLRDSPTRLVTLTGLGGVGKTSLAREVAAACADDFADGVWWVALENVRQPEAVPTAIAEAGRLQVEPGRSPAAQLLAAFPQLNVLLVCDNFEQVIGAAGFLTELLQVAPKAKCLVTSRVPLRMRGERLCEVPPLPLPSPDATDVSALTSWDSVKLFVERAECAAPGWTLTSEDAPAVAEICRRLEGIPLCIELVATRARGMTAQEMLEGLRDSSGLPASRDGTLPERQRTVRAALDWSYQLLAEDQRCFLAQLAVFRGGFFRESAEEVTDNGSALDLILELQSHSLVYARPVEQRMRYGMLDIVRDYAAERLRGRGEDEESALRTRHAACFCGFAERQDRQIRTSGEAAAMAALSVEVDNLRAALEWAFGRDDLLCARLAVAVWNLFERRGLWDDARRWAERGLEAARRAGDEQRAPMLLLNLASIHHDRGDLGQARIEADQALQSWRQANDSASQAKALNLLGVVAHESGDDAQAVAFHERALALRRGAGDRIGEAMSLHNLGLVAQHQGDDHQAELRYREALAVRRELGDSRGAAETLCNLGVVAQDRGDLDAAKTHYGEALQIWREFGDRAGTALALHNLGEVAATKGNFDMALPLLAAAAKAFRRIGSPLAAQSEAFLESLRERPEAQPFGERLQAAQAMPWEAVLALAANA